MQVYGRTGEREREKSVFFYSVNIGNEEERLQPRLQFLSSFFASYFFLFQRENDRQQK